MPTPTLTPQRDGSRLRTVRTTVRGYTSIRSILTSKPVISAR